MNAPRFSDTDTARMRVALELAASVKQRARPNPAVGCVIVAAGEIVGQGATEAPGGRHAEVVALAEAGSRAAGAHAFVSLEPCAHFGRTPPCVDALIAANVAAVTVAVIDPDHRNQGAGIERLVAAGIETRVGLLADDAAALNAGFFTRCRLGRPRVTAKIAASIDGAVAMRSGESQWITGPAARHRGHAFRANSDALITGIGTVLADDPRLTARGADGSPSPIQPLRVIVDSRARLPTSARLFDESGPLLHVTTSERSRALAAEHIVVSATASQQVDLALLLQELGQRGINDVLLEAGPTLTGAFAVAGLIDEIRWFVAPLLLGSETRQALETPSWLRLTAGQRLSIHGIESVGDDYLISASVSPPRYN
ncbi:MAG: bifunctional diaminohydroxyphosphoribosylaminopyrimidine deaminase/5-amino-6-(5-phosphoribosylamino)uracil reductase RibD [Pseudomonadota bacterium]